MAWRFNFRKSVKSGLFRWTFSKRGVSTSVGIPGLRFGVSATGKRHITVGLPGTGIYWTNNLDAKQANNNQICSQQNPSISPATTKPIQNQNNASQQISQAKDDDGSCWWVKD